MAEGRPDIPRPLRRAVLEEAGYRCAIPACGSETTVAAHIVPWAKVREHTFDNLIALCPNCHARYDRGDIERLSILQYKTNLGLLTSRYGEMERRVLSVLAPAPEGAAVGVPGGMELLLMYLLKDGLLVEVPVSGGPTALVMGVQAFKTYTLTPKGREFAARWWSAQEL